MQRHLCATFVSCGQQKWEVKCFINWRRKKHDVWSKLKRLHFIDIFLYQIYIRLHLHGPHLATVWLFPQAWRSDSCAPKWSGQRGLIASCDVLIIFVWLNFFKFFFARLRASAGITIYLDMTDDIRCNRKTEHTALGIFWMISDNNNWLKYLRIRLVHM